MRTVRVLLVLVGAAATGYGWWLLWPSVTTTAAWLIAGPVVHDAVMAPLVGLAGLLLLRVLPHRRVRWWVTAGLAVTGTLVLIAIPLLWRPHRAAPNPGLQDRDYLTGLAVWLAGIWAAVALAAVLTAVLSKRRHPPRPPRDLPPRPPSVTSLRDLPRDLPPRPPRLIMKWVAAKGTFRGANLVINRRVRVGA